MGRDSSAVAVADERDHRRPARTRWPMPERGAIAQRALSVSRQLEEATRQIGLLDRRALDRPRQPPRLQGARWIAHRRLGDLGAVDRRGTLARIEAAGGANFPPVTVTGKAADIALAAVIARPGLRLAAQRTRKSPGAAFSTGLVETLGDPLGVHCRRPVARGFIGFGWLSLIGRRVGRWTPPSAAMNGASGARRA